MRTSGWVGAALLAGAVLLLCGRGTPAARAQIPAAEQQAGPSVDAAAFAGQGRLAFVQDGTLYALDGDAGSVTPLSNPGEDPVYPRWSPDGQWVAYVNVAPENRKYGGRSGTLHIVAFDGSENHTVDALPGAIDGSSVQWSPTADVLAVAPQGTAQNPVGLWLVQVDGAPRQIVSGAMAGSVVDSAWSPDGSQIAFVTRGNFGDPSKRDAIWTDLAAGGDPMLRYEHLPPGDAGLFLFGWSPDGAHLLFAPDPSYSASIEADGVQLFSLPLDGGDPVALTHALVYPDWRSPSPDGLSLALVAGSGRGAGMDKTVSICNLTAGGCTDLPKPDGTVAFDPAWSPDGGRIAYVQAAMHGEGFRGDADVYAWFDTHQLMVSNTDGSNAQPLSPAGQPAFDPEWSADGDTLLYVCGEQGGICLIAADGSGLPQQVVEGLGAPAIPGDVAGYYGHIDWSRFLAWQQ